MKEFNPELALHYASQQHQAGFISDNEYNDVLERLFPSGHYPVAALSRRFIDRAFGDRLCKMYIHFKR